MLDAHNEVRKAAGLKEFAWSDKLARIAGNWANYLAQKKGCTMLHRPRTGAYGLRNTGENLYWASGVHWSSGEIELQKLSAKKVVDSWAGESADYLYETNTCKPGKECGHYTQIVWKQTRDVGCARAVCSDKSQVWVCNYFPAGNLEGHKPY